VEHSGAVYDTNRAIAVDDAQRKLGVGKHRDQVLNDRVGRHIAGVGGGGATF
jgi:hypothetical protein